MINAEIATAIEENLATTNYGDELATRGITTVALDADGQTVECPHGTTTVFACAALAALKRAGQTATACWTRQVTTDAGVSGDPRAQHAVLQGRYRPG